MFIEFGGVFSILHNTNKNDTVSILKNSKPLKWEEIQSNIRW
jgi:hypothetical protein